MVKIVISIVLFNNRIEQVTGAIRSCLTSADSPCDVRIVLVDNSPTDRLKVLAAIDPRISYRFMNANLGYGTAHNVVLKDKALQADYNLVLNPDMLFEPTLLERLSQYMADHPRVGLCIPGIVYPDGTKQSVVKLLPTPTNLFLRRFSLLKTLTEKSDESYELKRAPSGTEIHAPFLSGCFMFIRSSILDEVGFFDERYFMYLEDADLSRRIFKSADCVYLPQFEAIHEHQKESYKNKRLLKIHIQSALKYFFKWGWVIDRERSRINKEVSRRYSLTTRRN